MTDELLGHTYFRRLAATLREYDLEESAGWLATERELVAARLRLEQKPETDAAGEAALRIGIDAVSDIAEALAGLLANTENGSPEEDQLLDLAADVLLSMPILLRNVIEHWSGDDDDPVALSIVHEVIIKRALERMPPEGMGE